MSPLSLRPLPSYGLGFPAPVLVLAEISAPLRSDSVCLPSLGGSALPCDLSFLMDLTRVANVKFVRLFSCRVGGSDDFQVPCILPLETEACLIFVFDRACVAGGEGGSTIIVNTAICVSDPLPPVDQVPSGSTVIRNAY